MEENKMKKKLLIALISLGMVFNTCAFTSYADDGITVTLNGDKIEFDVQPQLIDNRTMVPLRKIFEAMGAVVDWDDNTQTVTATKDSERVIATINNKNVYISGETKILDVPPMVVNDRTLVPVRFVAESFGANVDWVDNTQTVVIRTADSTISKSLTFVSDPSGYFEVNYVNGIEVAWGAKNTSGKTINYYTINYTFMNPVGDLAYDEITKLAVKNDKIVGPIHPGETISDSGIIGYVPACHSIRIDSIDLEYADGSTEHVNCGQIINEISENDYETKMKILDKILG